MTKILTKVVAGLGVATGLSIAALPLATHAVDVITSVTIVANNNAGSCSVGTATTSTPGKCTGGGNSATGYTITITDKDNVKLNLSASDVAGGASGGFAPIAAAQTTVSGTNVYGVKFSAAAAASEGYTGAYTGTFVTDTNMSGAGVGQKFVPVKATSIGTILTAGPGLVDVTTNLGEAHNQMLSPGTYRNTISIVYAAK